MSEFVKDTNDDQFEVEVLQSKLPALVDFWAEWCGPCKMITPIIAEVAKEFSGRINVFKVNVDENASTSAQYGIRSIPSLILFKDGEAVATNVGAMTKSQLVNFIEKNI